ncbi:MAG: type II secretion system F family protein [Hyphomicrobiales bacterium]
MSNELVQIAILAGFGLAVAVIIYIIAMPFVNGEKRGQKRVAQISGDHTDSMIRKMLGPEAESKDARRKQVQDTLNQIEQRERARKKRLTIEMMLKQAGIEISVKMFWILSLVVGSVIFFAAYAYGYNIYICSAAGFAGAFGLPRWFVNFKRNRRQALFLAEFANAIDVIVRGLKAGLPVNDTLKVIATETVPPVGPEFAEVVEGQRVGITIEQGIERMHERVPLPEVNFLAIVIAIQARSGGNLAEALGNLSTVLRDRKKMKAKIRSVSQEAKSSAAIIGSLPPLIMIALYLLRPDYISLLWTENLGKTMLAASAIWMTIGVLIMRKMINFKI